MKTVNRPNINLTDLERVRLQFLPRGLAVYRERDRVFQDKQPLLSAFLDYGEETAESVENATLSAIARPLVQLFEETYGPSPRIRPEGLLASLDCANHVIMSGNFCMLEHGALALELDVQLTQKAEAGLFPLAGSLDRARVKLLTVVLALELVANGVQKGEVLL